MELYRTANQWIENNYSGKTIDSWSKQYLATVDWQVQKQVRRDNAQTLYEGLEGSVEFLFPMVEMDSPLFVPVLLREDRDKIRRKLIEESIFCPVHWPRPQGAESNLYDMELSLICDQRYGRKDMNRIGECLRRAIRR